MKLVVFILTLILSTSVLADPPTVGGLSAVAVSETQINLTWTDSVTTVPYVIERSTLAMTGFVPIATTAVGARSYSNTALTPNVNYYYRVREVGNSASATATTHTGTVPPGSHRWSKKAGGTLTDYGLATVIDSTGSTIVVGVFSGVINFGGGNIPNKGSLDVFVAKFDSNGIHLWSRGLGGTSVDSVKDVVVDSLDNIFIVGDFEGTANFGGANLISAGMKDVFLAKLSGSTGAHIWSKRFGYTKNDLGHGVAVDSSGSVIITGQFPSFIDFDDRQFSGSGTLNATTAPLTYVAKLDTNGVYIWAVAPDYRNMYPANSGQSVVVNAVGDVVVSGNFGGFLSFGGETAYGTSPEDIYVAKFASTNGAQLWVKSKGFTDFDNVDDMAIDSAGNVAVIGYFSSTSDWGNGSVLASNALPGIFIVKWNGSTGAQIWGKGFVNYGGSSTVAFDSSGDVYMAGSFVNSVNFGGGALTSVGGSDLFVVKFSSSGVYSWAKRFGDTLTEWGTGIAVDASGPVVTGLFASTLNCGGTTLATTGQGDMFVCALTP